MGCESEDEVDCFCVDGRGVGVTERSPLEISQGDEASLELDELAQSIQFHFQVHFALDDLAVFGDVLFTHCGVGVHVGEG